MKLKAEEIRKMTPKQRKETLLELRNEVMLLQGGNNQLSMYCSDVMRIRPTKRSIARILTVMREKGEI